MFTVLMVRDGKKKNDDNWLKPYNLAEMSTVLMVRDWKKEKKKTGLVCWAIPSLLSLNPTPFFLLNKNFGLLLLFLC